MLEIEAVKQYIRQNLNQIHLVADVAKRFGVSGETLRKEFSRQVRIPFSRYLAMQRLEAMKNMLLESDLLCFQVAYQVGFRRQDSAAKNFKRLTGMSMQQYRKQQRERRHDRSWVQKAQAMSCRRNSVANPESQPGAPTSADNPQSLPSSATSRGNGIFLIMCTERGIVHPGTREFLSKRTRNLPRTSTRGK